jgi:hypothetical protein
MKAHRGDSLRRCVRLLVFGLIVFGMVVATGQASATSVGQPAFDFQGNTMDGERVSLESYVGRPLVLVFWGSW